MDISISQIPAEMRLQFIQSMNLVVNTDGKRSMHLIPRCRFGLPKA